MNLGEATAAVLPLLTLLTSTAIRTVARSLPTTALIRTSQRPRLGRTMRVSPSLTRPRHPGSAVCAPSSTPAASRPSRLQAAEVAIEPYWVKPASSKPSMRETAIHQSPGYIKPYLTTVPYQEAVGLRTRLRHEIGRRSRPCRRSSTNRISRLIG